MIISGIVGIAVEGARLALIGRMIGGEDVSLSEIEASADRREIAGYVVSACFVVCAVTFIRWFATAYKNLVPLGSPPPRFRQGWAIGGWFVPVLNLWRPKQLANEIWRSTLEPATDQHHRSVSALVTAWWAAWIALVAIDISSAVLFWSPDTLREDRNQVILGLASLVVEILAAVLAILVVRRVTARQDARAVRCAAEQSEAPADDVEARRLGGA